MKPFRIRNKHKRELAELTKSVGLDLFDFEFVDQGSRVEIRLKSQPKEFFSVLHNPELDHSLLVNLTEFSIPQGHMLREWPEVIEKYVDWIFAMKEELNPKTGWEAETERLFFFDKENSSIDRPFTVEEAKGVREGLSQLKISVCQLNINDQGINVINGKLDALSEKVDKLSVFDWKAQLIGTIISLVTFLALPQEQAGMFWSYAKAAFKGLFRLN